MCIRDSYPIYTRKKGTLSAPEELLFDCNELAKGHAYFNLKGLNVSPDNTMVAFGTDTIGRRQYSLQVKNLYTNKILKDKISYCTGSSTWANDNNTLFYTLQNKTTLRSEAIYKHKLGTETSNDQLVFEEKDVTFGVGVYKTKSKKYFLNYIQISLILIHLLILQEYYA